MDRFPPSTLISAIEANLWELGIYLGQSPQVEVYNQVEMLWYATGIACPMLNGVLRTQLSPSEIDARIETTQEHFRSRGLPLMWWIGPSTQPVDFDKHLETHGFTRGEDMLGMSVDLSTLEEDLPLPPGLVVRHVTDIETLKEWAYPFAVTFGFDGSVMNTFCDLFANLGFTQNLQLQHYVGWLRGDPVACSTMFLGAGVAGIYNVATVPDKRGQGIGAALTWEPLHAAHKMGYRLGVLHSSQAGYSMYRRMGFEEYCRLGTYISPTRTKSD